MHLSLPRRISEIQALGLWIGAIITSALIIFLDCNIIGFCRLSILLSILSILLGFGGTIVIALPSIFMNLGRSLEIEKAKEFNRDMKSAYNTLEDGGIIKQGSDEYNAMVNFLYELSDYEGEPTVISKGEKRGAVGYHISVDGNDLDVSTLEIPLEMKQYVDRIGAVEEWEEEVQERIYVLLGCGIYGLAIIFQASSTIITNMN